MSAAAVPRPLGKYRPIAELGRGGMATVYLASVSGPAGFNKLVVVKQLLDQFSSDPEFREMFLEEAKLSARLNHPHVVQTNEITEHDGRLMIVMEYLDGQSYAKVRQRFQGNPSFTSAHVARILIDTLDGLHAAHELTDYDGTPLNVVHRDVSPHNVFITYTGDVKVVDFGIAKAANTASSTRTGMVKGKVRYMAPEQAVGARVDRRSDVFAAGVMLWEALAKKRFWQSMPDAAIMHALVEGRIPSIRDAAPEAEPALLAACEKALAHKADDRYATAADMREDLLAFLETSGARRDARELGTLVAGAFDVERQRIRAVVEEQMRRASSMPESVFAADALPRLDVEPASASSPSTGSGSHSQARPVASGPSHTMFSAGNAPPPASDAPLMSPLAAPVLPMAAAGTASGDSSRSRERALLYALGAVAVVAVLALVYMMGLRSSPPAPVATTTPVALPTPPPPTVVSAAPVETTTALAAPSTTAPTAATVESAAVAPSSAPALTSRPGPVVRAGAATTQKPTTPVVATADTAIAPVAPPTPSVAPPPSASVKPSLDIRMTR